MKENSNVCEKFTKIKIIELVIFLCLGTILSQISRTVILNMNFIKNLLCEHEINFGIMYLFSYSVSIFLASIIILIYVKKYKSIELKDLGFKRMNNIPKMLLYSVLAVVVAMILYELVDIAVRYMPFNMYWSDSNQDYSVMPQNTKEVYMISIGVLFLVPFAEDLIYRGVLINYLKTKMSVQSTVIMASIIFSAFHLPFYGIGLSIYMFFWTIISCLLYIKFNSIYPCIIYHTINNLLAYIVFPMVV